VVNSSVIFTSFAEL